MKFILKLLLASVLLFSILGNLFAAKVWIHRDHIITTGQLLNIKSGESYKTRIDSFMETYSERADVLEKLRVRIERLKVRLPENNTTKSQAQHVLIDYIDQKAFFALLEMQLQAEQEAEKQAEEELKNPVVVEPQNPTIIFPGFWDNYNDNPKVLLAGESAMVYQTGIASQLEEMEAWEVVFYIQWSDITGLKETIDTASLYLAGTLMDTSRSSDIDELSTTMAKITFNNVDDFIITQNTRNIRLELKTNNIGFQRLGTTFIDLQVSRVWFDDITWITSWSKVPAFSENDQWEEFSILPWVLELKLERDLSSNLAEINIVGKFDNNVISSSSSVPRIELKKMRFSTLGSSDLSGITFRINNQENTAVQGVWVVSWNILEFDMSALSSAGNNLVTNSFQWEDFQISFNGTTAGMTLSLRLLRDGIDYEVIGVTGAENITFKLPQDFNIWSRSY